MHGDRSDSGAMELAMAARRGVWVRVKALTPQEKADIATQCERVITDTLKPKFLPEIRPTEFNYPVDIFGKWRTSKYSFAVRYRSGFPENAGEEFDAPFARLDHCEDRFEATLFDLMWMRHTGRWWLLYPSISLEDALHHIATDGFFVPC
jgi:hypothetical protein